MHIQRVTCIPLPQAVDDRGYLLEICRRAEFIPGAVEEPHAVVHHFGQTYLVQDPVRGTIRAFHKHLLLWDWFCIIRGAAKFVLVEERGTDPKISEIDTYTLSAQRPMLLTVPPGIFHGWMSLEDNTWLLSTASEPYNRLAPDETRVPPDHFGDVWKVVFK